MAIKFSDGRAFEVRRVEIPPQPERALPCDMKVVVYEGKDITPTKFDRNAYQREYMRAWRRRKKEQKK